MDSWIQARISEGMFPNERTAHFQTVDEGEVAVFVSSTQVERDRLRVELLDQDSAYALVQVPSHGGMTVAKIRRAQLFADAK